MPASRNLILPLLLATTFALNACAKNNDESAPAAQNDTSTSPQIEDTPAAPDAPSPDTPVAHDDTAANEPADEPTADAQNAAPAGTAPAAGGGLQLQLGGSNPSGFGGASPRLMDGGLRNP